MMRLNGLVCALFLTSGGFAQPPSPPKDAPMNRLAQSAEERLAASVADLNRLRDEIAAEKIPMSEQLTTLEDRLTQLRAEYEKVTRLVDAGNLEIATIKTKIKERQDDLTYLGNLLDEYARTFESKVNISELQYCGEAIVDAKDATENTTLSQQEKLTRQADFVNISMKRLDDAIGGMRFPGVGVDLQGTVTEGQFAIIGPVALFSANDGKTAGVVVPQTGSANPLIRPLEGSLQEGLTTLVASGQGVLPLDPSRGGALKALVQKFNLIHVFEKGGPIMWPLLAASILALGVVIERLLFLLFERFKRNPKALERFFFALGEGDIEAAIRVSKGTRYGTVRALGYALSHRETSLANALVYAQAQELKRFQRGIPILDTVITLAPLLGLLGTVTGMMGSFALIGGELSSPGAITGGIAEALIATAFGLGIAITALLPFNFLNARTEQARHEMESAANQLELLVNPRALAPAPTNLRPNAADALGGNGAVPSFKPLPLDIRRRREAFEPELAEPKPESDDLGRQSRPIDLEPDDEGQLVRGQSGGS